MEISARWLENARDAGEYRHTPQVFVKIYLSYLLIPVVVVAFLLLFFIIVNGKAFRQGKGSVTIREPGYRLLGPPQPVAPQAAKDVTFALLSQAAYQHRPPDADATKPDDSTESLDPRATLHQLGWEPWKDFPSEGTELQNRLNAVHLRVEIWSNESNKAVVVAFGGTEFRNLDDWKSNLRWFMPVRHDEYSTVIDQFAPKFVEAYKEYSRAPKYAFLRDATLYSTGHSLGAGLAEEFAYSLPIDSDVPRVLKVYAFDPTPVTGFTSVKEVTRRINRQNLKIDRIYERGEVLAALRSITSFFHLPPACNPMVRQIRYDLFWTINVIKGHSISDLASQLWKSSAESAQFPDPELTSTCSPTRKSPANQ